MKRKEYIVLFKYSDGKSEESNIPAKSLRQVHINCEDMINENAGFVVDFEVVGTYCPFTKVKKYFS